jgi:antitoxin (DNA-binding transcriptional repressor) of toxin-antitoxin stability system
MAEVRSEKCLAVDDQQFPSENGSNAKGEPTMTVTLQEAQAHLPELIEQLQPGESLVITRNETPVARLTAEEAPRRKPRQPGNCKGMLTIVSDDDEHLKDFAEYME